MISTPAFWSTSDRQLAAFLRGLMDEPGVGPRIGVPARLTAADDG